LIVYPITFKLEFSQYFRFFNNINLAVRDYPGEIFEELASGKSNRLYEDFIDECLMKDVSGCLIGFRSQKRTEGTRLYDRHVRVTHKQRN